jgi:spore coat polysaccharide biosynthesis protein SpsF (cytidylyltransferase family)
MNIIAITQARYGSTRLPAKVLKTVVGKTLLDIHIERILQSKKIASLIVATTNEAGADAIETIARKHRTSVYKGSVNDVLERFYLAVKDLRPDYVVRLTSDCPLVDPVVIDEIIDICITSGCDYASNTLIPTYPDGVDAEVFRFSVLEKAFIEATLKSDREHVTPYIWRNSSVKGGGLFSSINISCENDYSNYRITVDTQEDFDVVAALIKALGTDKKWFEYINYLNLHPEIRDMNNNHTRNEGYTKSLLTD